MVRSAEGASRTMKAPIPLPPSFETPRSLSSGAHSRDPLAAPQDETRSQHPQRLHIGFQNRLGFGALVGILLAQAHDGAQRLDVETVALAFGVDVADVVGDGLLLFLQPLDALDDSLELVFCESCR